MSQNYLAEAFQKLEMLNEDTFNVTDDGVDKLALFLDGDNTEELTILDAEAETVDDLETNYIGKVILDCNVCHTKCYEDKENVVIDEETQCANVDQECAYCHCMDGFKVVGQVAEYSETATEQEPEEDPTTEDDALEENLNINEEKTNEYTLVNKQGVAVDKNVFGSKEEAAAYANKNKMTDVKISGVEKVDGKYNGHFEYDIDKDGNIITESQQTPAIDRPKPQHFYDMEAYPSDKVGYYQFYDAESNTKWGPRCKTEKELWDWVHSNPSREEIEKTTEYAEPADIKKAEENKRNYLEKNPGAVNEDLNHISVETDDSTMEINHEENGSVSVTTTPNTQASGEMITPVDDTLEADIMANGEQPVDDTSIEDEFTEEETLDSAEEFVEESFDTLVGKYLTRVYENVNKYKTKKITAKNNQYVVEGLIKFNSGKIKPTTFLFECKNNTLVGKNSQLARNRKAFTVKGRIQEKKFIAESFNYNYKAPVDGKPTRVYGTIKG